MPRYDIRRGNTILAQVKARGSQHKGIMVEDRVVMDFKLHNAIVFKKGDTVEVFGQKYKINQTTSIMRSKDVDGYSYSLEFEALYYDLGKWFLNTLDQNNDLTQKVVYIMSTAEVILDLVVRNANQIDSGWSLGEVDATEVRQHNYDNSKLLTVLQDLADKYENEFWFSGVDGKTINFSKREIDSGIELSYGAGNGLYEISRERSDTPYYNRLYIQGGSQNLPADYGFQRLQLPLASRPFIDADTDGFDIVEENLVFENIFPKRVGVVSGIGGSLEVFDTSLDFDINDHLTPSPAKIAFISGQLAGFTFSINDYNHTTKKISFNLIDDDPAYPSGVPNSYLKSEVGDKYVLLDIEMPLAYITAEANKLLAIGNELIAAATNNAFKFGVSVTPKWVVENTPSIVLGNLVLITDTGLAINENLRILGYDRDLQQTYRYGLDVGSTAKISSIVKEATSQSAINNAVTSSGLSAQNKPGTDTLDTVARRGRFTGQILAPRGVVVSDLFSPPSISPSVSEMETTRWYMSLKEAAAPGTPSVVIANLGDLLDVDASGRADDYVMYWDAAAAKYKFKAASFAPSDDVYTKSQVNNFFSGVTGITGYNKSNWDSAFGWGNHSGLYQPLENQRLSTINSPEFAGLFVTDYGFIDTLHVENSLNVQGSGLVQAGFAVDNGLVVSTGSSGLIFKEYLSAPYQVEFSVQNGQSANASIKLPSISGQLALVSQIPTNLVYNDGATYGINIGGTAAKWGGITQSDTLINSPSYFLGTDGTGNTSGFVTLSAAKTVLNISDGSTLNNNISGAAAKWGGESYVYEINTNPSGEIVAYNSSTNRYNPTTFSQLSTLIKSAIGLNDGSTLSNNISGTAARATLLKASNAYPSVITDATTAFELVEGSFTRVDFHDNNGAFGGYANTITTSSYDRYAATQISTSYNALVPRMAIRNFNQSLDNWNSWVELLHTGNAGLQKITDIGNTTTNSIQASRLSAGYDSGVAGSVNASNWFRSNGGTGWVNDTYGGGIQMTDSSYVRIYGGKEFYAANYIGSASGFLGHDYGIGLVGQYSATRYQSVFSMGTSYRMAYDGTSLSSHYGIAWTHENMGGQSKVGLGHQMLITEAGVTQTAIGNGIWTRANITAAGKVTANTVQATAMLVVPKTAPVVADMPVGEWVLRIREAI